MVTHTGEELWAADMSQADPRVIRFAGQRGDDRFNDGPCAAARLANTHGVALLPGGSLVVADYSANALVLVTDPAGPACAVSYYAGTSEALDPVPSDVPNQGDVDGPGATARFRGVKWPVADEQGAVYVVDEANQMVRGGGAAFPPVQPGRSPILASIASNGTHLYVSGSGYIWKLQLDGALSLVAGTGLQVDFPPDGYDPLAEHPALELALKLNIGQGAIQGTTSFMTYEAGALYWTGINQVGYYVEKITCE